MLNQTGPLGTVASQWDIAGRRARLTWPDTFHVTYDRLVTGETTAIRENGAVSRILNMPNEGKWKGSIMADAANDVGLTDLEAVVEAWRAAQ